MFISLRLSQGLYNHFKPNFLNNKIQFLSTFLCHSLILIIILFQGNVNFANFIEIHFKF